MNHTTTLSPPSCPSGASPAGSLLPPPAGSDEEPDSPEPHSDPLKRSAAAEAPPLEADPLVEIGSLLSGITLAILALVVPLAAVVADPARPALLSPAWRLNLANDPSQSSRRPPQERPSLLRQVSW